MISPERIIFGNLSNFSIFFSVVGSKKGLERINDEQDTSRINNKDTL